MAAEPKDVLSDISSNIAKRVVLTPDEKAWIEAKHSVVVRLGEVPPYHFTLNGKPHGLSVDYLKVFFSAFSIRHAFISQAGGPFSEALRRLAAGETPDLLPTLRRTPEREGMVLFTRDYVFTPWVIYTRVDSPFIGGLDDLRGKVVAVESGYVVAQKLRHDHPSIRLAEYLNSDKAMEALALGQADAYVGDLSVGTFIIQRNGYTNVKVAAPTDYPPEAQAMGIRRDWPELVSIIDKALAALTPEETQRIINNSISIKFDHGLDWSTVGFILAAMATAAMAMILFWNRRLKSEIGRRKRTEAELRKREEQFLLFIEHAPVSIAMLDTDMRHVIVSKRWLEDYGCAGQDIKGRNHYDVFPEIPEKWRAIHRRCLEGATARAEEDRFVRSDGKVQWVRWEIQPWRSTSGQLGGILIFSEDVTERKRAVDELREASQFLGNLITYANAPIIVWNPEFRITRFNRAFERLTGLDRDNALGQPLDILFPPDKKTEIMDYIRRTSTAGERWETVEIPIQHQNGAVKTVLWNSASILDAEGKALIATIAQGHDITERKQAEEALRLAVKRADAANHAKSEFLANMSHEIRTPLNGIIGMIQLLELTSLDEEQAEYIVAIKKSSRRLTRLLTDILDLSRVEAGKLLLHATPFKVGGLKNALSELLSMAAREKNITLDIVIDKAMPPVLVGDENRLVQILFNLVGNSIKFSDNSTVRIEASPLSKPDDTRFHVLFTVTDMGIGISDEQIASIFDPFTQAEGAYNRRFQGAGLGLSIVKRLVKMMDGEIAIDSSLGEGTTMYLSLPFPPPPLHEPAVEKRLAPGGTKPAGPLRVLLAEDDEVSLMSGKILLEKSGFQVLTATDGQEALRLLAERDVDLILMDVQMPVMDGVAATRAIRNSPHLGAKSTIPIIAMTAYAMTGDKETFLAAGMNGYVSKPVDMAALMDIIERLTGRAATPD